MKNILVFIFCVLVVNAAENGTFETKNQEWGYVEVRPGAHIFYWLYHTTASKNITEKPLIIVIPGTPGTTASYSSNFRAIGPLDDNLKPRNTSWVHSANVLFVDSPVGTGFSSVESNDLYATTDDQASEDFVSFLRGFYKAVPNFKNVPVYIFSNDYAAKIAVKAAFLIHRAVKNNTLTINLKGLGLGSSWISPVDNIHFAPKFFYARGLINTQQYYKLSKETNRYENETERWTGERASYFFNDFLIKIENFTGVNAYNVLRSDPPDFNTTDKIQGLMDKVRTELKLNATWKGVFNVEAFLGLVGDFMKPVTHTVERLLNETDVSLAVYNGQYDGITNILGATSWLSKLHFNGSEPNWLDKVESITVNGVIQGDKRETAKLAFYTVLRAGHLIAQDNPIAMQYILEQITDNFKV